jgi:SAM-dependent methyltransferase
MEDAFGQMLLDGADTETIERDDGFLDTAKFLYFAPVTQLPAVERRALRWVRGRVLDAGLGAGRVALELQRRGRSVVGIDNSPGAVEVARQRGVHDVRLLALEEVDDSIGWFDTIVMLGNNFGLFAKQGPALAPAAPPSGRQNRGSLDRPSSVCDGRPGPSRLSRAKPQAGPDARPATAACSLPRPQRALVRLPLCLAGRNGVHPRRYTVADHSTAPERQPLLRRHSGIDARNP